VHTAIKLIPEDTFPVVDIASWAMVMVADRRQLTVGCPWITDHENVDMYHHANVLFCTRQGPKHDGLYDDILSMIRRTNATTNHGQNIASLGQFSNVGNVPRSHIQLTIVGLNAINQDNSTKDSTGSLLSLHGFSRKRSVRPNDHTAITLWQLSHGAFSGISCKVMVIV
jgi:hypothetical protein